MNKTPRRAGIRWLLLAGVYAVYLIFGLLTAGLAPLAEPIAEALHVGSGTMGLLFGLWPLAYIAASVPGGMLLDRLGLRRTLLVAVAIMAVSALLRAFAQTPAQFAAAVALFGIGGPLVSVGAPKLIAQVFDGRTRGAAMGVYITGPYVGGILALSLTNSIMLPLAGNDWRGVMVMQAGLAMLAGLVWLTIALLPTVRALIEPRGGQDAAAKHGSFADMAASGDVRLILAIAVGIFALNHALINWLPSMLVSRGMSATQAGFWASIPAAAGILGALTIPRFATPNHQARVMACLLLCMLCATLLLRLSPGWPLAFGLVLQGVARGTMMPVALLLLMESRDISKERFGLAGGMFFTTAQIGGVLGPTIFGALFDGFGDFGWSLGFLTAICALLLILLHRLARQRRKGLSQTIR